MSCSNKMNNIFNIRKIEPKKGQAVVVLAGQPGPRILGLATEKQTFYCKLINVLQCQSDLGISESWVHEMHIS
jgi:hypothetical protein